MEDNDQDGDSINFVNVYGRPMYYARMSGKPYSLMRDGYPGTADKYFEVEYPAGASGTVAPHKHNNPDDYSDDDFFEIMNEKVAFQELMKNYTFVLRYTGSRWYGQIIDPNLSASSFKEEEFHAFWMNTFSGKQKQSHQFHSTSLQHDCVLMLTTISLPLTLYHFRHRSRRQLNTDN